MDKEITVYILTKIERTEQNTTFFQSLFLNRPNLSVVSHKPGFFTVTIVETVKDAEIVSRLLPQTGDP